MGVTESNLIQGPATLYVASYGVDETGLDVNVNTVPPASAGWLDVGATMGGIELDVTQTYKDLEADQIIDHPGARLTDRMTTVKTSIAEVTFNNLTIALNDGTAATGAGFSTFDPKFGSSATQPTYRALLLDGFAPNYKKRRFLIRKVLSTAGIKSSYKKDAQTVLDVEFSCYYVNSTTGPFRIIDQTV